MVIAELVITARTRSKLADHSITTAEVEQLVANLYIVTANPHPRVPGSRLLIGRTNGGRTLTVVLQPDHIDPSTWWVMTGWDASPREAALYTRHA